MLKWTERAFYAAAVIFGGLVLNADPSNSAVALMTVMFAGCLIFTFIR